MVPRIKFILVFAFAVTVTDTANLRDVMVPAVAIAGTQVKLKCDYDESRGSKLYSLKWYKDGKEIYRHVPATSRQPSCSQSASLPGVTVDCWASSDKEVVLMSVSHLTSGVFQCEIIGDHPDFRKEEKSASLRVVREAVQLPAITGAAESYRRFDTVNLNCSSTNREYEPILTWRINGRPARRRELIPYNGHTLGLRLTALAQHFTDGTLDVSCTASLGPLPQRTTQMRLKAPELKPAHFFSTGFTCDSSRLLIVLTAVLNIFLFNLQ